MMLHALKDIPAPPWSPESWRDKPARQLPDYGAETGALEDTLANLKSSPALVTPKKTRQLEAALADAAAGKAFVLQAGDCAESFAEFSPENIAASLMLMAHISETLAQALNLPVIQIGRIAGQFAKPRSETAETRDGITLHNYQGDIVNDRAFSPAARRPAPKRILQAHAQAEKTLPLLPASFYTSHESLLLPYEEALLRQADGRWFGASAHFLWVGNRTRQPEGAHVEFLRGIANPIGIKCGPDLGADELLALLDILNPANTPGRITLISRMGHDTIETALPPLLRAVKKSGQAVVWSCDPMHGNTRLSAGGVKIRACADILSEIRRFFALHKAEGTHAGGLHLELTGQNVTECTDENICESNLHTYRTHCDPRLNPQQALALAQALKGT